MNYYLYTFLDPRKPGNYFYEDLDICFLYEPFYIGKGTKNRLNAHFYPSSLKIKSLKSNKIKAILNEDCHVIKEKLYSELSQDEAFKKEILFINKIGRKDLNKGTLCNLTDGMDGSNMIVEKTRKPVVKIDKNTLEENEEYISISEAALKNNTHISNISACCRGKANTHLGYFWKFKENDKEFPKDKRNRKILEYDYNSENLLSEYNSIGEAAMVNNIKDSIVSRICSGELIKNKNKYFRYKDNNFDKGFKNKTFKKVILIENKIPIIFNSIKDCAEHLNCSTKSIWEKCKSDKIVKHELYYFEDWNIKK